MKIIVFDLDETLGFFSQFGTFWELLLQQNSTLTHTDFSELLDLLRTSHDKSYDDLIRCINCQTEHKICFVDDVHHTKMVHDSVYYINVKPYVYMLSCDEIVRRFVNSRHRMLEHVDKNRLFLELKKYSYSEKDSKEYIIDSILSKQIMIHLQDFLNKPKTKDKGIKDKRIKDKR